MESPQISLSVADGGRLICVVMRLEEAVLLLALSDGDGHQIHSNVSDHNLIGDRRPTQPVLGAGGAARRLGTARREVRRPRRRLATFGRVDGHLQAFGWRDGARGRCRLVRVKLVRRVTTFTARRLLLLLACRLGCRRRRFLSRHAAVHLEIVES